jgi:hypothetical protein
MALSSLEDAKKDHALFMREVHIELAKDLIADMHTTSNGGTGYGSPVLSGQFAGSIRAAFGDGEEALQITRDKDFTGEKYRGMPRAIENSDVEVLAARLKGFELGDAIFVGNTLHYGEYIEAGSSRKAPNGVRGPTMDRFRRLIGSRMAAIRALLKAEGIG